MVAFSYNLNFIDILSFKPEIKITGRSRFITNLGKIMSIICLFIILIISFFISMDVFLRSKFNLVFNLSNRENPKIKINESQASLVLLDALGNELNDHYRYHNFLVKYSRFEKIINNTNNLNDIQTNLFENSITIELPLRNCSQMNYRKFTSFYRNFGKIFNSGLCIDFSNFNQTLFGNYGKEHGYSTLNIFINKCVNNSIVNKTDCFPEEDINMKLSQVFISLVTIENDIDPNNYEMPLTDFLKYELFPISSSIFKNYFKESNSILFTSDNGFIFENKKYYESHNTLRIFESVDLRDSSTASSGTFSQITIRSSGKTEFYLRNYIKIPAIFAYIAGIFQSVIMIGKAFVYFFSKNSMLSYLICYLFDSNEINYFFNKKLNFENFISQPNHDLSNGNLIGTHINRFKNIPESNNITIPVKFPQRKFVKARSINNMTENKSKIKLDKINKTNNSIRNVENKINRRLNINEGVENEKSKDNNNVRPIEKTTFFNKNKQKKSNNLNNAVKSNRYPYNNNLNILKELDMNYINKNKVKHNNEKNDNNLNSNLNLFINNNLSDVGNFNGMFNLNPM